MTSGSVSTVCHERKLRVILSTRMKTGEGELEEEGGKAIKDTSCGGHAHLLPKMSVSCMSTNVYEKKVASMLG